VDEALGVADVLDVLQRAGLEVVHADHPVPRASSSSQRWDPRKPAPAGDQAGGHGRRIPRQTMDDTDEHLTVAPIVGPDDRVASPTQGSRSSRSHRGRPARRAGPGRARRATLYTRCSPPDVPRPAVDDAPVRRLRSGKESNERYRTCSPRAPPASRWP
jgi:hypothetical protein